MFVPGASAAMNKHGLLCAQEAGSAEPRATQNHANEVRKSLVDKTTRAKVSPRLPPGFGNEC